MTPQKKKTGKADRSFAERFEELEEIVASFEKDELDLDSSLRQFERGLQLAEELKKTLETTENKIEQLKKKYSVDSEE